MRRSQLQPVINAAAAGGKIMATWARHKRVRFSSACTRGAQLTRMRRTSEPRTMVDFSEVGWGWWTRQGQWVGGGGGAEEISERTVAAVREEKGKQSAADDACRPHQLRPQLTRRYHNLF